MDTVPPDSLQPVPSVLHQGATPTMPTPARALFPPTPVGIGEEGCCMNFLLPILYKRREDTPHNKVRVLKRGGYPLTPFEEKEEKEDEEE